MERDRVFERLIDALQVVGPLARRIEMTSRQQAMDAAALLEAAQRAVAIVREEQPGPGREKGGA